MKRPTLALCAIFKNEKNHMERFIKSFKPYVDNIYLVDTGTTDGSNITARNLGAVVSDFPWINDFSAARDFSFEQAKEDFIMWADLDDALDSPEAFLQWRDHAMGLSDYWFVNYHYASDANGNPLVTFARERVVKRSKGYKWKFFVHEGLIPESSDGTKTRINHIQTWAIRHMRTEDDMRKDRKRNLDIFDKRMEYEPLSTRMQFYYGKELFDNEMYEKAAKILTVAASLPDAQHHDRVLSVQYAALSFMKLKNISQTLSLVLNGLALDPNRAEFHCLAGDALLMSGNVLGAKAFYRAALECSPINQMGMSPLYSQKNCYTEYPTFQLAQIYANIGDEEKAKSHAKAAAEMGNPAAEKMLEHLRRSHLVISGNQVENTDIVFTCPPQQAYPFDPEILREKGVGGSETALIHMAHFIKKHAPDRKVKIFTQRGERAIYDGVEYIPTPLMFDYFSKNRPRHHIAWRHNIKITDAKTYVWSHDLITPGISNHLQYSKLLCLSEFHKNYAMAMQGVPADKIHITRNGIMPERFTSLQGIQKVPGKVVWSSSLDRGADRVVNIVKGAREQFPELNLHIFYGVENMRKFNQGAEADRYEKLFRENSDFVTYHGNVDQQTLARHYKECCVCLYPSDFIETFAITMTEAACGGAYIIVRDVGAMKDTLTWAKALHGCEFLDCNCETKEEYAAYHASLVHAMSYRLWEKAGIDPETVSWESIAKTWLAELL